MDLALDGTHALASHEEDCPDIGPICAVRAEPPQRHVTSLWLSELRLFGEYGLGANTALQGVVPLRLIDTRTEFTDLAGKPITLDYPSIHHRNETLLGLGDVQLLIHRGTHVGAVALGVRAGVSLPFGKVQPNPYKLGDLGLPHEHIQFGTGTLDPLLGVDVMGHAGKYGLSAFAFTQAPLLTDAYGYQAGTRLTVGAGVTRSFVKTGPIFRVNALAYQEWAEQWDGKVPTEDGNLGRTDVYLAPGVTLPFATDWSASVDLRLRVFGQTVGAQLQMPVTLSLSIGRLFHFEAGEDEEETLEAPSSNVEEYVLAGEARPIGPERGRVVIYDFWAPWCEACKVVDGKLRTLAAERPDVLLRRVNIVDFDSAIAHDALPGVSVLPHVRVFAADGTVAYDASATADEVVAGAIKASGPARDR